MSGDSATLPSFETYTGGVKDASQDPFLVKAERVLREIPESLRQRPSAAASPVLRWLLLSPSSSSSSSSLNVSVPEPQQTAAPENENKKSEKVVSEASGAAPARPAVGLALRGVGVKDPLTARLAKKKAQAAAVALSASSSSSSGPAPLPLLPLRSSHWTSHRYKDMTNTSWRVFRQQLGIDVELVSHTNNNNNNNNGKGLLPSVDTLPAMRCWEEGQLPLSLGNAVATLYSLPTAVQAQCVPLTMHPHGTRGLDLLAVAETGSGKTIAYAVPLLYHVLYRVPALLGHPDRISLGPPALVLTPTKELAEQVTAVLLRLIGQLPSDPESKHIAASLAQWEKEEKAGHLGAEEDCNRLSSLRVVKVVGGESREAQYERIAQGAHIVVGTVGQLQSLLEDRYLSLGNASLVVMDEADRMIEENMQESLDAVLRRCPAERQTLMFTATLSSTCAAVAKKYLGQQGGYYTVQTRFQCASIRQNFELVSTSSSCGSAKDGEERPFLKKAKTFTLAKLQQNRDDGDAPSAPPQQQQRRPLNPRLNPHKFSLLTKWLCYATGPIIIFANEKSTCDILAEELRSESEYLDAQQEFFSLEHVLGEAPEGLHFREDGARAPVSASSGPPVKKSGPPSLRNLTSVAVVHANLSQNERRSLVTQFQQKQRQVLLTTDLLARGLDVSGVQLVINYDLPWSNQGGEDAVTLYVHRIGRTGRAGSTGVVVSFVALPAAMVQRAEQLASSSNASAARKSGEDEKNNSKSKPMSMRGEGGDNRDDVLASLFAGADPSQNVLLAGVVEEEERERGRGLDRKRRRTDSDDEDDVDGTNTLGDDEHGGQQKEGKVFASDQDTLKPLWAFLVKCVEESKGQHVDGGMVLAHGGHAKISVPPPLACIMQQLSASSQYGRILL